MSGRSSSASVAAISASSRCSGAELGRRRDLDALGLLERALRERGEVREPLDLDVEQLAAHRALLGGRVDVEDVAAQRELAAVLDLVDALVAAGDELRRSTSSRSSSSPFSISKPCGRSSGSGTFSLSAVDGGDHDARPPASSERVERGDPQADEVRRRREVRLVLHAARRVEAHGPRREEGLQVGGEVARRRGRRPRRPARAARARRRAAPPAGTAAGWRRRTRAAARCGQPRPARRRTRPRGRR